MQAHLLAAYIFSYFTFNMAIVLYPAESSNLYKDLLNEMKWNAQWEDMPQSLDVLRNY